MGRGGCAGQGGLTSWAEAAIIRPDVLALTSGCARWPCADVAEHTTPASRHGRRQELEKCEEVPHEITLFKVECSSSITWGSSVFHKSLKRGQRAPVAFPCFSHLLPLHQLLLQRRLGNLAAGRSVIAPLTERWHTRPIQPALPHLAMGLSSPLPPVVQQACR